MEAIEEGKVRVTANEKEELDKFIESHDKYNSSNKLTISLGRLANAIKQGYEVGPELQINDFVKDTKQRVLKIVKINGDMLEVEYVNNGFKYSTTIESKYIVEYATKQEAWWAKNDREVWELKTGDVLFSKERNSVVIVKLADAERVSFNEDRDIMDSRWEFKTLIVDLYEVVCFVEGRLD